MIKKERLEALIAAGLTQQEIAAKLSRSQTTISHWCVRYGLKMGGHPSRFRRDLCGLKVGMLTILRYSRTTKKVIYWHCRCQCGKEKEINGKHLKRGAVKSCGCLNDPSPAKRSKGYESIRGEYFNCLKKHAMARGLPFEITIEEAWAQYIRQNRKCALSAVPIDFPESRAKQHRSTQTASLDRIDSNLGYTTGNIQWVHKVVNNMKWHFSNAEYIEWCKKVAAAQQVTPPPL